MVESVRKVSELVMNYNINMAIAINVDKTFISDSEDI